MGRITHHISAECFREPGDWARAYIGTPCMTCITRTAGESLYPYANFSTILPASSVLPAFQESGKEGAKPKGSAPGQGRTLPRGRRVKILLFRMRCWQPLPVKNHL